MERKTITLIVLGMLILSTACSAQGLPSFPADASGTQPGTAAGGQIQLQQEGIGPLEITPLPPGEESSFPSQDGGNISSSGARTTSEPNLGEPGMVDSKSPAGLAQEEQQPVVVNWLSYQDRNFDYSIDYPDSYLVLTDEGLATASQPGLLSIVRFIDQKLAGVDTADLEIPQFTIEVFDTGDQTLEQFVDSHHARGELEVYQVGDLSGFRVQLQQLIAPNQFIYLTNNGYVFRLTPLGEYSQKMLASFKIQ